MRFKTKMIPSPKEKRNKNCSCTVLKVKRANGMDLYPGGGGTRSRSSPWHLCRRCAAKGPSRQQRPCNREGLAARCSVGSETCYLNHLNHGGKTRRCARRRTVPPVPPSCELLHTAANAMPALAQGAIAITAWQRPGQYRSCNAGARWPAWPAWPPSAKHVCMHGKQGNARESCGAAARSPEPARRKDAACRGALGASAVRSRRSALRRRPRGIFAVAAPAVRGDVSENTR